MYLDVFEDDAEDAVEKLKFRIVQDPSTTIRFSIRATDVAEV